MPIPLFRSAILRYTLLFTGVLCISWSAIFVKLSGVEGITTAFYRMLIGSIGVIPIWIIFKNPTYDKKGIWFAILSGILFGCDIVLWNTSITLSKASISTLLANLAPVWVGLSFLLFWKKSLKPSFWIGTFVAIAGVAVIVGFDQIFSVGNHVGNLLAIAASVFYAAYMISTQKGRLSIDTLTFTAISMWTSTIFVLLICLLFDAPLWGFGTQTWASLAGLGLISQLGGWLAINYALGHIKTTTASVTLLSQSVFTALFSVPVLGEMLTANEVVGAVIVLAGIYLVNKMKE
ncbi:MAG: DMT family transporter [Bacteroidales bacterium]|nr:DMT family transporter [Bacteroidales bacterium]